MQQIPQEQLAGTASDHPTLCWLGMDIGSTTVKAVVTDPVRKSIVFRKYLRHDAKQRTVAAAMLREIGERFPSMKVIPVFCGSGSRNLAEELRAPYIQEVVANSLAVREFYPETRVAIELGGQDAKVTFFHKDQKSGHLVASDMRMNGRCAGGTGAFLDEVASLLKMSPDEMEIAAARGATVYDISGRCGVFAKTDIQPLLNQGVCREDLALSCYHAVAKQTIGGLAQGLEIHPPVIFEGGPLYFNPTLVKVFSERLNLRGEQAVRPEHPEVMIAYGATLGVPLMFADAPPWRLMDLADHPVFRYIEEGDALRQAVPFFKDEQQKTEFLNRHTMPEVPDFSNYRGQTLEVYLGIDAGSTTGKFVLLDKEENLVYRFYGKNHGEPLKVIQQALLDLYRQADELKVGLNILGVGTTGYGGMLFQQAFRADVQNVETVAHAEAALKYLPGASFILDIGGQDMKAIFLNRGIVTGISLNEACSAGCGSFLENFAASLKIPVTQIATMAFASRVPSLLGSRCTVFMNSSVITEQKNGKTPDDIMAGLCNSIIENVFTKVIRLFNLKHLGSNIVVQGGTFKNDAVLRSLEMFVGRPVVRAPYPGEMGAIGIALLTKKEMQQSGRASGFLTRQELEGFSYEQESGLICGYCSNNCNRTRIRFSSKTSFITGNRCERGEIVGEATDPSVKEQLHAINARRGEKRDLFRYREKLLFMDYPPKPLSPAKELTIGIPRALDFWESYPFWNHFFRSLGFRVQLSAKSTLKLYEEGLFSIPSDTVCFPAKLAHGHLLDLVRKKVDRIFMPIMSRMIPENSNADSSHTCAVLKGYPMVLRASHETLEKYGIPMDTPTFHWTDAKARRDSLVEFVGETFGLPERTVVQAIDESVGARELFSGELKRAGEKLLETLSENEFAVVIAGRPYHSDDLINHHLSDYFARLGIPSLPLDALPDLHQSGLSQVRSELTVNYHVRMFGAAEQVAAHPRLEYVQIVSFGCGHDAVISDEITRFLNLSSGKSPLILKMDESEVTGPLNLRVKSFVETVRSQRKTGRQFYRGGVKAYEVVFDRTQREKTILVPNVSWAFGQVATAAIRLCGYRVEALPLGGELAIKLGRKYVNNDMCFPAQINIGEFLAALEQKKYHPDDVVLALAKDRGDCRLAHYAMMARQALDDAGYTQVPLVTTDRDVKGMHPAFKLGPLFELRMVWGLVMMDALEDLCRKIRPYEKTAGETDRVFTRSVLAICQSFNGGLKTVKKAFRQAVEDLKGVGCDRSLRKPRVFMIGEFLLNFHPGSNNNIEEYLVQNGLEVLMPNLFYNIQRDYMLKIFQKEEYHVSHPAVKIFITRMQQRYINHVIRKVEKVAATHPFWEKKLPLRDIAKRAQHIIDKTFTSGEGWMIAGEILHHADQGVNAFLILQPFGCMPNHVTGRGLVKAIKKEKPHIQVLALDYDPDMSMANLENRLQMLIINTRERGNLAPCISEPVSEEKQL
jgi:predicted CoA-substrate-specific enzyme activase